MMVCMLMLTDGDDDVGDDVEFVCDVDVDVDVGVGVDVAVVDDDADARRRLPPSAVVRT